jgi:hypothetical protein
MHVELGGGDTDWLRPAKPFPPKVRAASQWTPPEELAGLAEKKLVAALARHRAASVRENVARRRDLPYALQSSCSRATRSLDAEALEILLADESARVRAAAAALEPYPKGTRKPPP